MITAYIIMEKVVSKQKETDEQAHILLGNNRREN